MMSSKTARTSALASAYSINFTVAMTPPVRCTVPFAGRFRRHETSPLRRDSPRRFRGFHRKLASVRSAPFETAAHGRPREFQEEDAHVVFGGRRRSGVRFDTNSPAP